MTTVPWLCWCLFGEQDQENYAPQGQTESRHQNRCIHRKELTGNSSLANWSTRKSKNNTTKNIKKVINVTFLPRHTAQKSCQKLVRKSECIGIWSVSFFCERRKTQRKTLWSKDKNQKQTQPTWRWVQDSNLNLIKNLKSKTQRGKSSHQLEFTELLFLWVECVNNSSQRQELPFLLCSEGFPLASLSLFSIP